MDLPPCNCRSVGNLYVWVQKFNVPLTLRGAQILCGLCACLGERSKIISDCGFTLLDRLYVMITPAKNITLPPPPWLTIETIEEEIDHAELRCCPGLVPHPQAVARIKVSYKTLQQNDHHITVKHTEANT